MNEEEIFKLAVTLPCEQRVAYVQMACAGQPALRERIERLLASHEDGAFMQRAAERSTMDRSPELDRLMPEQPGERIGQYQLLRKIGEGGFGVVWMAEQLAPVRRRVALKIIKLGMDTRSVIARFEQERQALALMEHPHIAKALDAGATPQGRPFFVMELVEGSRITEFCQEKDLCIADRLRLVIAVCQAVQHAHQKGIIHRDLKPSNILVTIQDGTPVPKVIDFGIAKATTGQRLTDQTLVTAFEQFLGTPAYMSPEQAERSETDIDTRSDIYSLGVLLYELLTGTTPFTTNELMALGLDALRRTIREKEPPPPSTRLRRILADSRAPARALSTVPNPKSKIHSDLDWIVLKCLEKDRTRRYETVNGLAMDLKRFLDNEPVVACPPTAAYRLKKFVRRNKAAVTGSILAIFLLLAGVVGTALGLIRSAENARKLEASLDRNRVALAHEELSRDPPNIQQAEKLLESCSRDMRRQWEWHYLKRQWLDEPFVRRAPGEPGLNSVSFSSDDRSIAAAGADGSITVWDVVTRQIRLHFAAHTNKFAYCVAFDPTDSTRLVSAGYDDRIRLWDLRTTNAIYSWPSRRGFQWGMGYAVAFSPDGQHIAGPTEKGSVTIWSATSGEEVGKLPGQEEVFCTAFSPDGRLLAVGRAYGFIDLWDTRNGKSRRTLGSQGPPVASLAFSHRDGQRLAATGFDNAVTVWDVTSQRELLRFDVDTKQAVGVAFSPDNQRLATAGFDRTIKLWDARTGQELITFRDFAKEAQCVAFSHDGRHLAACSSDGTVRLWDGAPRSPDEHPGLFRMQQPAPVVATMSLYPEGLRLASAGGALPRGTGHRAPIFIWDLISGRHVQTIEGHEVYVFQVAFSPDGCFLASIGDDIRDGYTAWVWDAATGHRLFSAEPFAGEGVAFCLAYSPNGQHLLAGSQDARILVWNAATGQRVGILGASKADVFNLVFSPNGCHLASATQTGVVQVWDGTRLQEYQTNAIEIATVVGDSTDTLAFAPDSRRLVVATDDQLATIWDLESRTELSRLQTKTAHGIRSLAVSPDGRWIASGGMDSKINLWDSQAATVRETLRGHRGEVTRLLFLHRPEGLRLISGGRDGSVIVWDMSLLEQR